MLTNIHIRNFKKLDDVSFELGQAVVLIGPNNSGKTTALQALALWEIGLRRWLEKRGGKSQARQRVGITINRRDLVAIPVPSANLLWNGLHVRNVERVNGDQKTQNIRIDIVVEGITEDKVWKCGLEFDFTNQESFYCRPLRLQENAENVAEAEWMPVPDAVRNIRVAYLPPMSGLADREFIKQPGEIAVLIGQGQTAQVLRNLCYGMAYKAESDKSHLTPDWARLTDQVRKLFGVELLPPRYIVERSEIVMSYKDQAGIELDISSSGRGLQQTLLLLAYLYRNPGTTLLLDEPDAHLEILRQRQIYQLLTKTAQENGSQIIAASHSEVVLNEAADRDIVIAFVGKPHRVDGRASQVLKSLRDIGFDDYYQSQLTGWVLYLEGTTDLAILQTFAKTLDHVAIEVLEKPFLHTVDGNDPQKARDHFYGLREASTRLAGIALFDRIDKILAVGTPLLETMWRKREIENYLCSEAVLMRYALSIGNDNLFSSNEAHRREQAMRLSIAEVVSAQQIALEDFDPWSPETKATDAFLDPLFRLYFAKLQLPNLLRKTNYHELAQFVLKEEIDPEVIEKLDMIVQIAGSAETFLD